MAFLSMTGFGRGHAVLDGWRLDVEISGVNRKTLDLAATLPAPLSGLEPMVQAKLRATISRGRLSVRAELRPGAGRKASRLEIDVSAARDSLHRLRQLSATLNLAAPASLVDLHALAPFTRVAEDSPAPAAAEPLLSAALDAALLAFHRMRRAEGRVLQRDLLGRLRLLETGIRRIASRAPAATESLRQSIRERVASCLGKDAHDDARLAREIALLAERGDVTEELTRLRSHFAQFRASATSAEPVGRSLDFLCQEIGRELNTLASKTADHQASADLIGLKTELERIREQVQNVE